MCYAEQNGEQRLYSFLMAATLLLLACVTIFASEIAPNILVAFLAACGLVLSLLFVPVFLLVLVGSVMIR